MTSRISILLASLAALVAALGIAACGGSSTPQTTAAARPPSASAKARTTTVTNTVVATTTTPAGSSATTTTTSAAAAPVTGVPSGCTPQDLGIHLGTSDGTAGTVYEEFDFVNVSSRPCSLRGYPGVSVVLSSGRVDDIQNVRDPADHPHLVTVAPRARVPFLVGIPGVGTPCINVADFRFIPPNDIAYEQIHAPTQICGRFVDVTPVGFGQPG